MKHLGVRSYEGEVKSSDRQISYTMYKTCNVHGATWENIYTEQQVPMLISFI